MTEKHLPADAFERLENWAAARAVEIASQVCNGCGCGLDALEFAP